MRFIDGAAAGSQANATDSGASGGTAAHWSDASTKVSALTHALNAGRVDVAVHWLQLLLLAGSEKTEASSDLNPSSHKKRQKRVRLRRLHTLQQAVAQMLSVVAARGVDEDDTGEAGDSGVGDEGLLVLRPGLALRTDRSSCELSYAQLQMFALQQLHPEGTTYNVVRALRFSTQLKLPALQRTCDALLAKHEALRTCFSADASASGQPRQIVRSLSHFQSQEILRVESCDLLLSERQQQEGDKVASKETQLLTFIAKLTAKPFDLAHEAPIRVYAVVSPEEEQSRSTSWVLVVVMHHIVTDAASSQLFWRDFHDFYARFSRPETTQASALQVIKQLEVEGSRATRITYRDFACWQRARLRSGLLAPSLQYWAHQLSASGVPPLLELPLDRERSHIRVGEGTKIPITMGEPVLEGDIVTFRSSVDLQQAFSSLCRAQGASVFMGLLAVFYQLVARLSGQRGFVIGAPASGRGHSELQDVMGYFVNTLPLRLGMDENDGSFEDFLASVREVVLDAYKHMEVPFHKILEHLRASGQGEEVHGEEERRWQHPLFQVMFSWEQSDQGDESKGYEELSLQRSSAKFDLMLSMKYRTTDTGERVFEGEMEFPTAYFERSTIQRFSDYYLELLAQVTRSPSSPLRSSAVSMLPDPEKRQLVCDWGFPDPETPSVESLQPTSEFIDDCLHRQVHENALSTALHFEGTRWSYRELWDYSGRVMRALNEIRTSVAGVEDLHVGLLMDRGLENVAAMVGALRSRAAFVPLDTEFPLERLRYMARDSGLHVIITQQQHAATAADLVASMSSSPTNNSLCGINASVVMARVLLYDELEPAITTQKTEQNTRHQALSNTSAAETAAYILYTSGSTGNPKGVVVSHAALLTTLRWTVRQYVVTPRDVFLQSTSTTLDGSLSQLFSPLLVGASARITRPHGLHDLQYIHDILLDADAPISFCVFVPSYFSLLVDFFCDHGDVFPHSVRHAVLVGEAFPIELAHQFYLKQPDAKTCLVNEYGPTEASITSTFYLLPRELALRSLSSDSNSTLAGLQSVPIGRPIDDHPVLVLDADKRLVPVNVPGELYIGGKGVAQGYWQRPDLTTKSFIPHQTLLEVSTLFQSSNSKLRWYKTGDLVKWLPGGELVFLGRTDAQVKRHGMRIELQEIRNVLLRHPLVKAAEVLLLSKQPKPRGNKHRLGASSALVGFVMLADSTILSGRGDSTLDKLRVHLREQLPVHMVPQELRIVDNWPRTPNGKVDLRALATSASVAATSSRSSSGPSGTAIVTVQLATDILRQVWTEALGLEMLLEDEGEDAEQSEDRLMSRSFFELGGDSLAAIRAMALAQARGLPLALDQFFRSSSLPEMARTAASSTLDLRVWGSQALVPLNWSKTTSSSSTLTLFLFHDADGTVWKLLELARRLPFSVIGIQATESATRGGSSNGLNSAEEEVSSVEGLALIYWRAIQEKQSTGPYALGGFSFGCRVAHEVARLAVSEGQELLPLTLLDGLPFDFPTRPGENDAGTTRKREEERRKVDEYATETFDSHDDPLMKQLGRNYRIHCAMEEDYCPYKAPEATESSNFESIWLRAELYKTSRWHTNAAKYRELGVDIATVAVVPNCTHLTMLSHPSVELVARKIRESFATRVSSATISP